MQPQQFLPCFNYTFFHGVGSLIMNEEMTNTLARYLSASKMVHPAISSLVKDLMDEDNPEPATDEGHGPSYDFGRYQRSSTLTCNKSMAFLISEAIHQSSEQPIPNALMSLVYKLQSFDEFNTFDAPVSQTRKPEFTGAKKL